jgi:hypothetical protein
MRFALLILILICSLLIFKYNKDDGLVYNAKFTGIASEVSIYYEKFLLLTQISQPINLSIGILPLSGNNSGVCLITLEGNREILLDEDYWNLSSDLNKEMLIAHELGHCLCNRDHTSYEDLGFFKKNFYRLISEKINGFLYDGCPDSLMHYSDFSEFCYVKHFMYYWTEMFDKCR